YSSSRYRGSSRSTWDCRTPSISSIQARGRSRSPSSSTRPPAPGSPRLVGGRVDAGWPGRRGGGGMLTRSMIVVDYLRHLTVTHHDHETRRIAPQPGGGVARAGAGGVALAGGEWPMRRDGRGEPPGWVAARRGCTEKRALARFSVHPPYGMLTCAA